MESTRKLILRFLYNEGYIGVSHANYEVVNKYSNCCEMMQACMAASLYPNAGYLNINPNNKIYIDVGDRSFEPHPSSVISIDWNNFKYDSNYFSLRMMTTIAMVIKPNRRNGRSSQRRRKRKIHRLRIVMKVKMARMMKATCPQAIKKESQSLEALVDQNPKRNVTSTFDG